MLEDFWWLGFVGEDDPGRGHKSHKITTSYGISRLYVSVHICNDGDQWWVWRQTCCNFSTVQNLFGLMFFCPPGVILSFTYWGLCHHRRTGNTYESYEYNGMTLGVFYHGINLPFFARCIMFKYPFVVREVPWHKSGESVT